MQALKPLSLDDAPEGAVLGRDVLDTRGRLLLGKGAALDVRARELLRRRGIATVTVAQPGALTATAHAEHDAAMAARLAQRFRQVGDDAPMQALHRLLLDYRRGE